jgi:hypothetical protein
MLKFVVYKLNIAMVEEKKNNKDNPQHLVFFDTDLFEPTSGMDEERFLEMF